MNKKITALMLIASPQVQFFSGLVDPVTDLQKK